MFTQKVVEFLSGKGVCFTRGVRGSNYQVELDGNEIKLLDRNGLVPIKVDIFDRIEELMRNGVNKRGCARLKVGEEGMGDNTIMGNLAKNYYGKREGESIFDASCYIFAILLTAGCIKYVNKRYEIM